METLALAGVALYAWLSGKTSTVTPDSGESSSGGLGVVVPSGPMVTPIPEAISPGDANAIAGAIGRTGKAAGSVATGLTIGLGVGELVQNEILSTRKEVAPYTNAATPWAFGAAGAGVGVAVAAGALTVSVSAVAFVAFPIAVAVFAIIDIAGNIEMSIRNAKQRARYLEILDLVAQKQFRRAWDLAVTSVEKDEMPWMMPKSFRSSPGFIEEFQLGDSPTVLVEANAAPPSSSPISGGAELGTVKIIGGNTVRVAEAVRAAYKPAADAFYRDKQAQWAAWQKSSKAQEAWRAAHRAEIDAGNAIADALIAAQPWWDRYAFRWNIPFPPAADETDGAAVAPTTSTAATRADLQTDAGAGKVAQATRDTSTDGEARDDAAASGNYGPRRLAGGDF